jgi:glutamate carboxypeptidase
MTELVFRIRQDLPEALAFLEGMVSMESPSFDKLLVDKVARFVAARFAAIGAQTELIPTERFGDHVVARFGPTGRPPVILLGHTDTVFPAGEIQKRPFKIQGNRATGPGVFDMKGGILLMWMALRSLSTTSGTLSEPVTVLLTSDEEVGSTTSRALIEKEARGAKAVLVLEPSLPGGVLKTERKGVGRFTVKAIGRAAHAGIEPEKGINAVEEIAHQTLRLQKISDFARGTSVTVGVVQGGTRVNVVPAEAALEVDVRVKSMEEADRIAKTIRALAPVLPGARLEIRGSISRPPMERTVDTARLFSLACAVGASIGMDLKEGSTGGGSDGNLTSALGVPTLDGLGPVGDGAHSDSEYIEINSLPERAALIAGLVQRLSEEG